MTIPSPEDNKPAKWYPDVATISGPLGEAVRRSFDHIYDLRDQLATVQASMPAPGPTLAQIKAALQVGGSHALDVTGLIPVVAPTPPIPQKSAFVIEDTHSNRANYIASTYPNGTLYYETDRQVFYITKVVTGSPAWVYCTGVYSDVFANRPTLSTNDKGFIFDATDDKILYYWSGSAWKLISNLNTNKQTGSTYSIAATDFFVWGLNTGAQAFTLPDLTTTPNQVFIIKNDATSTHNITIDTTSAQTVDNAASGHYVLVPGDSLTVESPGTGTDWKICDHFVSASTATPVFAVRTAAISSNITTADFLVLDSAGGTTQTLPDATTCSGQLFAVKNEGTGVTTLAAHAGGQTVDNFLTYSINPLCGVIVQSDGSNFWILADVIQPLSCQIAYSNNDLTLSVTPTQVPNCSLTLAAAGIYLVIGVFCFSVAALDVGQALVGQLNVGASAQAQFAIFEGGTANDTATVTQQWVAPVAAGTAVHLFASKNGGTGTSVAEHPHCSITAFLVHP